MVQVKHYVLRSCHLSLLEGLPGQEATASRLEQREVPPGLNVSPLFQFGESPRSEENLKGRRKRCIILMYLDQISL